MSQNYLFEQLDESFRDEWKNMPEYVQEDLTPFRVINVRFRNAEDVAFFEKLMEQKITEKQKTLWFPYAEPRRASLFRYADES
jgi:type III secretory pathway component EscR